MRQAACRERSLAEKIFTDVLRPFLSRCDEQTLPALRVFERRNIAQSGWYRGKIELSSLFMGKKAFFVFSAVLNR